MKTLIFNGSPRKNGDTQSLLDVFLEKIDGDTMVINAYESSIRPCIDCRYCWKEAGCAIKDGMQEVYEYIETCDNIVVASPIYFSELTGPLLSLTSRLQTYFCTRFFQKIEPINHPKNGGVILVGGGDGSPQKAFETAKTILKHMNALHIHEMVCSHSTNSKPSSKDNAAIDEVRKMADTFNKSGEKML